MGNDGGTKLRRSDLVKDKSTKTSENAFLKEKYSQILKLKLCALSQEPLTVPILSDDMGRLYNKTAVLEHLISKKANKFPKKSTANPTEKTIDDNSEITEFITSLNDFVELNVTIANKSGLRDDYDTNVARNNDDADEEFEDDGNGQVFKCPLTNRVLGSEFAVRKNIKFFYFAECGCLLSDEVLSLGFVELDYDAAKDDIFNYNKLSSSTASDSSTKDIQDQQSDLIAKAEQFASSKQQNSTTSAGKKNKCPNCTTSVSPYNLIYLYPKPHSQGYNNQLKRTQYLPKIGLTHSLKLLRSKSKQKSKSLKDKDKRKRKLEQANGKETRIKKQKY